MKFRYILNCRKNFIFQYIKIFHVCYGITGSLDQATTKPPQKPIPRNFALVPINFRAYLSKCLLVPSVFYLFSDALVASLKFFSSTRGPLFIVSLFLHRHIIYKTRSHSYSLCATICPQPLYNLGIGTSTSLAVLERSVLD